MNDLTSPIAIVGGTGALGAALAARLAKAGVEVRIGSRRNESANEAVATLKSKLNDEGAPITGHVNEEAVRGCEVVFLTVPFRSQSENLNNLRNALVDGQILVDTTVPLAAAISGKATRTIGVWQGSAAQQAAEMVPEGVKVVSALHSVSAVTLANLDRDMGEDVLVCGGGKEAKAKVARLIEAIPGLRAVDGGPLEAARIAEQITALLIGVNMRYKTHAGIQFTDLPEREW
ncbi:MAG TPA: NADPH-dependent F420 reductase [Solirubrobacterales bacterium]|jgi:NADPH-dependent F420 reductase|nr:NADPH-dependent F420 reductase [Solirubrobacterales bacterium]